MKARQPRFLIIRRDNIGDLVCTTPLITALRQQYPEAWIGALVNRYALPVLENNPDVSEVVSYEKAKHRASGTSLFSTYRERWRLIRDLRRIEIDYAILASPGRQPSAERMARWIGARHVVGFAGISRIIDMPVEAPPEVIHQVVRAFALLQPLGIEGAPPPLRVVPSPDQVRVMTAKLPVGRKPVVHLHISAREDDRRWPEQHFVDLTLRLLQEQAAVVMTWAPGSSSNPLFPGDDDRMRRIADRIRDDAFAAMPTPDLASLIAGLAVSDYVICSDGGPVHLAAALNKPVLCFFGHEDKRLWHPWAVPYELLQAPSRRAADISIEDAWAAWQRLNRVPS